MTRRELLTLGATVLSFGSSGVSRLTGRRAVDGQASTAADADITLRISEIALDVGPKRTVRTLAYNGQVPGPLLRARAGQRLTVDVVNDAKDRDIIHWHGFHIPSNVDGVYEEGTPPVEGGGRQRYEFIADPAGTRWYHSHDTPGRNLRKGTYTGQFGLFIVDAGDDPGAYDQDVPLLLHEWEPRLSSSGPMDVEYRIGSINGRMLGFGEPIRVRESQRVRFRIVNASATALHRIALPGHTFEVVALDGNTVPTPATARIIDVGPGERVDAVVTMNNPGVWVLGDVNDAQRTSGTGIVIEYAGRQGEPRWAPIGPFAWNLAAFASRGAAPDPDERLSFVFRQRDDGLHWLINGKSHPNVEPIVVEEGHRYRWRLDNQSAHDHPIHLHRHTFDVVRIADTTMSGIRKDVVVVPAWKDAEIDVVANNPGLSLFHCHQQLHMDMGFMAMVRYR